MTRQNTPAAEVDVDEELVRGLLADQCPRLAGLPIAPLASGWDNTMFRLGASCTLRLPRRALAATLVEHEQEWLPRIAARLPLPIPVPLHAGRPGRGYPWCWSVCPWLEGEPVGVGGLVDPPRAARSLAAFLVALHQPTPDAPENPFRGLPLAAIDARVRERAASFRSGPLAAVASEREVLAVWDALVETPAWPHAPVLIHGDLHPFNLLARSGRLSAVIDFGDITAGDPATDLALAWMLFEGEAREALLGHAGRDGGRIDPDTRARSRAWALSLSLAYILGSADAPALDALGRRTLQAALAG